MDVASLERDVQLEERHQSLQADTARHRAAAAEALSAKSGKVADLQTPEAKLAGQKHTHRLLAMVPPSGIQQIKGKQEDKVYTWPHLLSSELVCLLAVTAFILLLSITPAFPLRELANQNQTPNPSKAPWYFLGLQELLRYFHPMIAGVTVPGIVVAAPLLFDLFGIASLDGAVRLEAGGDRRGRVAPHVQGQKLKRLQGFAAKARQLRSRRRRRRRLLEAERFGETRQHAEGQRNVKGRFAAVAVVVTTGHGNRDVQNDLGEGTRVVALKQV